MHWIRCMMACNGPGGDALRAILSRRVGMLDFAGTRVGTMVENWPGRRPAPSARHDAPRHRLARARTPTCPAVASPAMRAERFMTLPRYVMRPVVVCTWASTSPQSNPHLKRSPLQM